MHMEHDENMGGHFPLALWKGYIRMHCANIFWGKKWKENKILQNHWKHCLKQIAWHKQHPHPKLPLMQAIEKSVSSEPVSAAFIAQPSTIWQTAKSTAQPEVQAWGGTYFATHPNTGNNKSLCKWSRVYVSEMFQRGGWLPGINTDVKTPTLMLAYPWDAQLTLLESYARIYVCQT